MVWGTQQWGQTPWSYAPASPADLNLVDVATPAVYLDNIQLLTGTTSPVVCNRIPPPVIPASLESLASGSWSLPNGTKLKIRTGHDFTQTDEVLTFLAAPGTETCANAGPYAISDGATLEVEINGLVLQTLVLTGLTAGAATPTEVVASINAQLVGGQASTSQYGTKITLRTTTEGTSAYLRVSGGTARIPIGFDGSYHDGTGDFYDSLYATPTEIAAVINARLLNAAAVAASEGTSVRLFSANHSLQVISDSTYAGGSILGFASTIVYEAVFVAAKDDSIDFSVFDLGTSGFDYVRVTVTDAGGSVLVLNTSTAYVHPLWTLTDSKHKSPGAVTDDIWHISLQKSVPFVSEDRVIVTVVAADLTPSVQTFTHEFAVEDWLAPSVVYIKPWSTNRIRIKFSESMIQTAAHGSCLYYRDISGRVAYWRSVLIGTTTYQNVIHAPTANFTASDVGMYIGSWGAKYSLNNDIFKISSVLSSEYAIVDKPLTTEPVADMLVDTPPTLVLSPYRLVPQAEPYAAVLPRFTPVVKECHLPAEESIGPTDDITLYAELELHDDLTPAISYTLEIANVEDLSGNAVATSPTFTSWSPKGPATRDFDLWEMIPVWNKEQDSSRDLERFVRCLDEVTKVMLNDIDEYVHLYDPESTRARVLDPLLQHLGNPFTFKMSEQKKRDLIPLLVQMYKKKGSAESVEDIIQFFLGKTVTVVPWSNPADTWELGVGELGYSTYIGPSASFVRYAFHVQHTEALTSEEEVVIARVVEFAKPCHTHYLGLIT